MITEEQDDLRATAEDIVGDAEELKEIEEQKLDLGPTSPAIPELSLAAERVAVRIVRKAVAERQLAEQLASSSLAQSTGSAASE